MITASNNQTVPGHVAEAFARYARFIALKAHTSVPHLDYHVAASVTLPNGATATLWVATAETTGATCYHLDVSRPGTGSATGSGACGTPDDRLSLDRAGALVIGSVGRHPAAAVRITTVHGRATADVDTGYFLIPPALTPQPGVLHTVQMLGPAGETIGHVTGLPAPGSAPPSTP